MREFTGRYLGKCLPLAAICLALFANTALALGLGELSLQSKLNEPFKAQIALLDVGSLNDNEIVAAFASHEAFAARNLERSYLFDDFHFRIGKDNAGNPVVLISSNAAIHEPYLGFILDLRWPGGRVQREYTALLDVPEKL